MERDSAEFNAVERQKVSAPILRYDKLLSLLRLVMTSVIHVPSSCCASVCVATLRSRSQVIDRRERSVAYQKEIIQQSRGGSRSCSGPCGTRNFVKGSNLWFMVVKGRNLCFKRASFSSCF